MNRFDERRYDWYREARDLTINMVLWCSGGAFQNVLETLFPSN